MSLRLLSPLAFRETLRLNLYDAVFSGSSFERMVVTRAVLVVSFGVIEHWLWRISARSQVAQHLVIISQKGVDQGDQSAYDMTNGSSFPFAGSSFSLRDMVYILMQLFSSDGDTSP
jgi:hypothetical protein